jgi:hypothetical protein
MGPRASSARLELASAMTASSIAIVMGGTAKMDQPTSMVMGKCCGCAGVLRTVIGSKARVSHVCCAMPNACVANAAFIVSHPKVLSMMMAMATSTKIR